MPSKSKQQAKLMQAAAHNRDFAEKAGVPKKVAQDFVAADKKQGSKRPKRTRKRVESLS
jgi:hypothetical protein